MSIRHTRRAVLGMLPAVGLIACAGAPDAPEATDAPTTTPIDLAAEIRPVVLGVMDSMLVPGAVVHVRTPELTWSQGFGVRVLGGADAVGADDYFRVGSVTKTMVGVVALQLVRDGLLDLDDPVSRYRTDVPDGDAITLRALLDMRSGLFSYNENESFAATLDSTPEYVWTPEELLRIGLRGTPYSRPGVAFRYSNTNTVLLAQIITARTGKDIGTELTERVFRPLGLGTTSYPAPGDSTLPQPAPHGYLYGSNVSALTSPILPERELAAARSGATLPTDVTGLDPSWIGAAGATISTARDLVTFARAAFGGPGLIGETLYAAQRASVDPDPADPAVNQYGLGLQSFGPLLGHDGAIPGFQTFLGHDPNRDVTVVVFCTVRDGPAGGRPANEIAGGIIRLLYPTR